MSNLPFEASIALEWFSASGERTAGRLRELVAHTCDSHAIGPGETRDYIQRAAIEAARKLPGFQEGE